jgi:4-hydroxybenzoate polyprenyltransferase
MNQRLGAFIRMLRVRALALILLFACLGATATGARLEEAWRHLLIIIPVLAAWYLHGTCINDLSDEAIDKVNLRGAVGRPLANKRVSRGFIMWLAVGAGIVCLAGAFVIGMLAFWICVIALVLNWVYSMPPVRLSGRGIMAPLLLPLGYVALPFLLAVNAVDGRMKWWQIGLLAGLYISFIGRIVLKDFRDVKGDSKYNKRTFIVRYGPRATVIFSAFMFAIGSGLLSLIFATKNILISTVLFAHFVIVVWSLGELLRAGVQQAEQVIIGGIAKVATASLICMLIHLDMPTAVSNKSVCLLLIVAVALFGAWQCIYSVRHTAEIKVVY